MARAYTVRTQHQYRFTFDPIHTALFVIDMQNDFCHPQGWYPTTYSTQLTRRPIKAIAQMLSFARKQSITIIFTREGHRTDLADLSASKRARYMSHGKTIGDLGPLGRILVQGEYGHHIIDEFSSQAHDIIIDKVGHGAFYGTNLDLILRERKITHLVITGVTTECCVHSTLREANDRGYWCLLLEDCCAALSENNHQSAMEILKQGTALGWVATSQDVLAVSSEEST